jgi:hypothetical protein
MKLNNVTKAILTLVFFFAVSNTFAQLPEDPDEDVDAPGAPLDPAPISYYLVPMLILGVATAFVLLNKKAPARI